jgi:hypothetical protein
MLLHRKQIELSSGRATHPTLSKKRLFRKNGDILKKGHLKEMLKKGHWKVGHFEKDTFEKIALICFKANKSTNINI